MHLFIVGCAGSSLLRGLCGERGLLSTGSARASHCGGFFCCGAQALKLLRGTWDPPGPGTEPMPPALAGRLEPTEPSEKPRSQIYRCGKYLQS